MKINSTGRKIADRLFTGVCLCLLLAAFFTPYTVQGKAADILQMSNVRNIDLGVWVGIGSLARAQDFCVASAADDGKGSLPPALLRPYQVKAENWKGPGGEFYLYLNNDSSLTGNQRVRVTIEHKDNIFGNAYEQLNYAAWDTHNHLGAPRGCPDGDNSNVRVRVNASDLAGKVSGNYRGNFTLTAVGGASGSATDNSRFRVDLIVQASPEVQISSLDNIPLGTHSGLGNINAEENFCVYSTGTSGSYNLSVSSINQDAGGNFYLDSTGGLGQIAYDLFFIDQGSGPGSVKVTNNTVGGFGNSADQFCGGANNATLSVTVREQDLQQAKSGTYRDTLVILVSPQ